MIRNRPKCVSRSGVYYVEHLDHWKDILCDYAGVWKQTLTKERHYKQLNGAWKSVAKNTDQAVTVVRRCYVKEQDRRFKKTVTVLLKDLSCAVCQYRCPDDGSMPPQAAHGNCKSGSAPAEYQRSAQSLKDTIRAAVTEKRSVQVLNESIKTAGGVLSASPSKIPRNLKAVQNTRYLDMLYINKTSAN